MKRALPKGIFSAFALSLFLSAAAQNDRFAYAVTDLTKEGTGWTVIRKLDLQTGTYTNFLFNGMEEKAATYEAVSKKLYEGSSEGRKAPGLEKPFATGVAAMAYDRRHNRLYFTPMLLDQLRYLDLKTMKVYCIAGQPLTKKGGFHSDEGKVVTRMVIAPDGHGYAITNDGEQFVRFTTGKRPTVTQLGSLVDDPANNGISVRTRCTGFGGDIVADDGGNFLLVSAQKHVFFINPKTRVAKYVSTIKNLPPEFTVNGMAVDNEGNLLVSSGVDHSAYYRVDAKTFKASPQAITGVYRSSDLANSNYLLTAKQPALTTITRTPANTINNVQVYPNPVVTNRFAVQFHKVPAGNYVVDVVDILGRNIVRRRTVVDFEGQVQNVLLSPSAAKGVYLVRVLLPNGKKIAEQKITLQ